MKQEEILRHYDAYKDGFRDGVAGDKVDNYITFLCEEYLLGFQDGAEMACQHLNFARWKDDYVRRQKLS